MNEDKEQEFHFEFNNLYIHDKERLSELLKEISECGSYAMENSTPNFYADWCIQTIARIFTELPDQKTKLKALRA